MKHISIRVAWHDNKWNGSVCNHPSENSYCIHLPRIYAEKKHEEDQLANTHWSDLDSDALPPCKAESGGFMSPKKYLREFQHPYSNRQNLPHNKLKSTTFEVPAFSTFSVPFKWMLRKNQKSIGEEFPGLAKDESPPFATSWVYGPERQIGILKTFFGEIVPKQSLVVLYTKSGNPVDEEVRRLIVGIGEVEKVSPVLSYDTDANYTYPLWDRLITHTIRQEGQGEGLLIPYHEYLGLADDFTIMVGDEKLTKLDLLDQIKITLDEPGGNESKIAELSYGSEWVQNSTILSLLSKFRTVLERIKIHGIARGNWDKQLKWVNDQIGRVKELMGPFPSFGNALVAYGFQHGHLLEQDIRNLGHCKPKDNPWDIYEDVLNGIITIPKAPYTGDIPHHRDIRSNMGDGPKALLRMLSRFEITHKQIKKWFDSDQRKWILKDVSNEQLIENPYIIAEEDEGDAEHHAIALETLDLGLFEDKAIQGDHSPEMPTAIQSPIDPRRIRATIIKQLKLAAQNGDTLLSVNELNQRLSEMKLERTTEIPGNYIHANIEYLKEKMHHLTSENMDALQLNLYNEIEDYLRKIFSARASKIIGNLTEDWERLIKETIQESGIHFDAANQRHNEALKDQVQALEKLTSRKLSVLHGPAGTGKTTVLGALFRSQELTKEGILLLAPTGKARVRLSSMASKAEAFTIAQFLTRQGRFDWAIMKPKFFGKEKYQGERTIIIDECSMLTETDFYALLQVLDLSHVKRIILVGDPFQLPPIGPGRPFADFCALLDSDASDTNSAGLSEALARLEVVVRTTQAGNSDTLTLASWFSGLKPAKNADEILTKLGDNDSLNDLRVETWGEPQELEDLIFRMFKEELGVTGPDELKQFDFALGIGREDDLLNNPNCIEDFQMLTPVRNPAWGSLNINRQVQAKYRSDKWKWLSIGDQKITNGDKVIQLVNEKREGYPDKQEHQLSNGQIGLVLRNYQKFGNVVYSGLPGLTFGYSSKDFGEDGGKIELAYAITVHKSQGSDFKKVFFILPNSGKLLSRELVYTALTRAKDKLIVLVQGANPQWIFNLSKPIYSESARRNSHLFITSVRESKSSIPYAEGLIHKALKDGLFVRSKSEVIIANMLVTQGIEFEYEKEFVADSGDRRLPDFTFVDPAGDAIILEHLGMLHKPSYAEDWQKKLKFYAANGFVEGQNLFTTKDDERGAIDSDEISAIILTIKSRL